MVKVTSKYFICFLNYKVVIFVIYIVMYLTDCLYGYGCFFNYLQRY
jgi:hypothetical protein